MYVTTMGGRKKEGGKERDRGGYRDRQLQRYREIDRQSEVKLSIDPPVDLSICSSIVEGEAEELANRSIRLIKQIRQNTQSRQI